MRWMLWRSLSIDDQVVCPGSGQVIGWDRGRPVRHAPQASSLSKIIFVQSFSRFALIAGGTPAVPANHLRGRSNHLVGGVQVHVTIKQEMRVVKIKLALSVAFMFLACLTLIPIANARPTAGKRRAAGRKLVKVYFYHEPGEYIDLAPVKRYVSAANPARAAIEALLEGPTREEQSRGFDGLASADQFRIGSLRIVGGTARVNFVVSKTWSGFPGDTAPIRFKKAVELTLQQFPDVRSVIVTLNGDPKFDE